MNWQCQENASSQLEVELLSEQYSQEKQKQKKHWNMGKTLEKLGISYAIVAKRLGNEQWTAQQQQQQANNFFRIRTMFCD